MSYRRAAKVVAVSTGSARDLIKLTDIDPNLVHVIPNPVITEQLFELAARPVEDPWFSNDSLPLLITVGRLTAAKNYPLLLKAFQRLLDKKDTRLVILGDGEERSELERLVREYGIEAQVKMPGYVDNPWAYMSKADLFVLSSKWEGLPTVLVEALALGIRVVSTDCEFGPRELLKDGKFGWLVPSEDYVALADTMLTALNAELPKVDLADLGAFRLDNAVDSYAHLLGVDRKRGPET